MPVTKSSYHIIIETQLKNSGGIFTVTKTFSFCHFSVYWLMPTKMVRVAEKCRQQRQ